MAEPIFQRLALIGIGLIGGSLALGAKKHNLAGHVAVSSRTEKTLARAKELGLGDTWHLDPKEAVKDADCVILSIPVGASGAVASDVGSVKKSVVAQMAPHLPKHVHFVPAHPVAGTEFSGPDAALVDLFENRWTILTPPKGTDPAPVETLRKFWRGLGANVEVMDPAHHDLVLAITSHVPHLIAYNIVGTAAHLEEVTESEVMKFSAGGFRDFTRIAASDPTMWRDVFLANKDAVLEMLQRFSEDLTALQRLVRYGEGDKLFELFTRTRAIRRGIIEAGQEIAAVDFGRPHSKDKS
jgi:cyclohexadieny/prephenate dehydrogenase